MIKPKDPTFIISIEFIPSEQASHSSKASCHGLLQSVSRAGNLAEAATSQWITTYNDYNPSIKID